MNNEIKNKWVDALTSGEFTQARTALLVHEGHCCLGVLCELYRRETGNGEWVETEVDGVFRFEASETDRSIGYLPVAVAQWAGVSQNPIVDGMSLTYLNDQELDFPQIAELIKSNL